jgi:sterol carrier protein 2
VWLLASLPLSLQAFLLRKLKLNGSMGLALKLQPILDAAAPRAKL